MKHLRSIAEIFDYAIERESEAYTFYKNLAPLVEKAEVREVIEKFAEDESRHKQNLEGVRVGDVTFSDDEISSLGLAERLNDPKLRADMTYKELLAYGIKKEDKAHKLYTRLAELTDRKDAKELLSQLAHEEAQHRIRLEFEYDVASF